MQVSNDFFDNGQDYHARGIVARIMPIGHYQVSILVKEKIYRYLTLDCGNNQPSFAVRFVAQAEVVQENGQTFLNGAKLLPGQIVVSPGFIYEKIAWSTPLWNEHLKALKTYKRKDIIISEKIAAPAIDLGAIDPLGLTKQ